MEQKSYYEALKEVTQADFDINSEQIYFSVGNRNLMLKWKAEERAILFYSELSFLSSWATVELCKRLLWAQFLLNETKGAAFCYLPDNNILALNLLVPVTNLEKHDFLGKLEMFIALCDYWEQEIKQFVENKKNSIKEEQKEIMNSFADNFNLEQANSFGNSEEPQVEEFNPNYFIKV